MKKIILTSICVLAFHALSMAQVPSYVPAAGLVGWWPFNGNANDQSGHALNGTITAATIAADRNNVANSAYYFNGVNGTKIQVTDNALMHTNTFTVSVWEKVTDATIYNNLISKRIVSSGSNSYILYEPTKTSCTLCSLAYQPFEVAATIGGTQRKTYLTYAALDSVLNNTWNMITGSYDGSNLNYYVNGQLVRSLAITGNVSYTSDPLFIGTTGSPGQNFKGYLDDIGIWNRALSASEIMGLYTAITDVPKNEDPLTTAELSIFPNPAKEQFTVRISANLIGKAFSIYNQNGIPVVNGKLTAETTLLTIEELSAGNYTIEVENRWSKKFTVLK